MQRNLNTDRLPAILDRLADLGQGLEDLYTNRSEILAEAGPIAWGFQSDYTGGIDQIIHRVKTQFEALAAYKARWFPVHGPAQPVVESDWPF